MTDPDPRAWAKVLGGRRVVVLTGAGCSTESGIPDYRGPSGRARTRMPMRFQDFMGSAAARARYWARSMVGWPRFSSATPNDAHHAVARLEASGNVEGVITQNVDGLHQAAGSRTVVELHGSLARVRCMDCDDLESRGTVQHRLEHFNPGFRSSVIRLEADGDAELPERAERDFVVPPCNFCGGILKPDVVFFGESVPARRLVQTWSLYERSDALLVVGSSLAVYSGRRFVIRAHKDGKPVAIVNLGPTRGDDMAALKWESNAATALPQLAETLTANSGPLPPMAGRVH